MNLIDAVSVDGMLVVVQSLLSYLQKKRVLEIKNSLSPSWDSNPEMLRQRDTVLETAVLPLHHWAISK